MKTLISKTLFLLDRQERKKAFWLLGVSLVSVIFDTVGIASIFPLMATLADPQVVETNQYFHFIYTELGFSDTEAFKIFVASVTFVTLIFSVAFRAFATWAQLRFYYNREFTISTRLLTAYMAKPYEWFLNRHSSDLSKTMLSEVFQFVQGILTSLFQLFTSIALSVFLIGLMVAADPSLALKIFPVLFVFYVLVHRVTKNKLTEIAHKRFHANENRFKTISETFAGFKELKAISKESEAVNEYRTHAQAYSTHYVNIQVISQAPRFLLEMIVFGGLVLILLFSIRSQEELHLIIPTLTLYAIASYRLIPALQLVYGCLQNIRAYEPTLDSIHEELLSAQVPLAPTNEQQEPCPFKNSLCLNKVNFSHSQAPEPLFINLSLKIKAATTVAVVGPTGCGKTTLVDLILGLLRPQSGRILMDDTALTDEGLRRWQDSIGYVPQSIFLTDQNIAANIAFGITPAEIEQDNVKHAARLAQIHDFIIGLPDGYDTPVGERGVRLSGGQRQRIGIARALYRNPSLLILDEATSALDLETERAVLESLDSFRNQMTILMVTHRLNTIQSVDWIYLLKEGKLVDQGIWKDMSARNLFLEKTLQANIE